MSSTNTDTFLQGKKPVEQQQPSLWPWVLNLTGWVTRPVLRDCDSVRATVGVASGTCHPLAQLGHCSCQLHLAQLFPQCAFGLSRLSYQKAACVQLPPCSQKTFKSFASPTALGNTSMSPALLLLCRHQALLHKTANTANCPLNFGHQWRDMANLICYTSLVLWTLVYEKTPTFMEMPLKCTTRVYAKKPKIIKFPGQPTGPYLFPPAAGLLSAISSRQGVCLCSWTESRVSQPNEGCTLVSLLLPASSNHLSLALG